jgi:hypothetical protein
MGANVVDAGDIAWCRDQLRRGMGREPVTRTPSGRALALAAAVLAAAGFALAGERPAGDRTSPAEQPPAGAEPARSASFVADCAAPGREISPLIYGMGGNEGTPWKSGATARRWGGNPSTRYNWERNTWNTNHDWFFRNQGDPGSHHERVLRENLRHGLKTALTVPILGWVAKDDSSYSFPVSVFGPQQATAPDEPDAGNGVAPDGKPIAPGPPTRTSVASTPRSIERWVRAIRTQDRTRGRSVHLYILDNEPMLWHETHRDVHPEPATYDELLEKTIAYAAAIRRADPDARIAGPAEWGWLSYHHSAKDVAAGAWLRPDRRKHGDVPLIPWYLRKIREHERRTGTRVLDVLDVHFYPDLGETRDGTDPATSARRIRSTRNLWDPRYVDEGWTRERMRILPLLRSWVDENAPGLGISIGEWNFGAEGHMSGGLAVAEALGRFGVEGLEWAFYWTQPPERSPAYWAFQAYRDFDGQGGRFRDRSVAVTSDAELASLFASRDEDQRRVVAVLLNQAPSSALSARLELAGCAPIASARGFTYAGGAGPFQPLAPRVRAGGVDVEVAPYSITVLDLRLSPGPLSTAPRGRGPSRPRRRRSGPAA